MSAEGADPASESGPDFASMTVSGLKGVAKERGLTGISKLRKGELIALLEDSSESEPIPTSTYDPTPVAVIDDSVIKETPPPVTVVVGASSAPRDSQIMGSLSSTGSTVQPFASIQVVEPPSRSAKVIGTIVLVGGVLYILYGMLTVLSGAILPFLPLDQMSPEERAQIEAVPQSLLFFEGFSAIVLATSLIVAGVWMGAYKRKGVHLGLLTVVLMFVKDVLEMAFYPDLSGFSDVIFSIMASGICGLIIAIPLFSVNHGLDDVGLFGLYDENDDPLSQYDSI
ncbi:MAG TPA: Rho termination factor N-terminal domain-containing protein [Candidatus Poseidoniales archaeon]|nr:Rho termination factor N-terminal domain-containing protein [Candidatus Poseidoniales archaeon]